MTLYDLTSNILNLMDNLSVNEETGEVDTGALDTAFQDLNEKLDSVGCYIKNITADAKAIAEEIKNLQARKKALETKAENLMDYVDRTMSQIGMDKFESPKLKFSYRKSTRVDVPDDLSVLPTEYIKTTIAPDKEGIKSALKTGVEIPGCSLVENRTLGLK